MYLVLSRLGDSALTNEFRSFSLEECEQHVEKLLKWERETGYSKREYVIVKLHAVIQGK